MFPVAKKERVKVDLDGPSIGKTDQGIKRSRLHARRPAESHRWRSMERGPSVRATQGAVHTGDDFVTAAATWPAQNYKRANK